MCFSEKVCVYVKFLLKHDWDTGLMNIKWSNWEWAEQLFIFLQLRVNSLLIVNIHLCLHLGFTRCAECLYSMFLKSPTLHVETSIQYFYIVNGSQCLHNGFRINTWQKHMHTAHISLLLPASELSTVREGIFTVAIISLQTYTMTQRQRGIYQTLILNITLFEPSLEANLGNVRTKHYY